MADDLDQTIRQNADGPAKASGDSGSMEHAQADQADPDTVDSLTWADAFLREINSTCGDEVLPVYSLAEEESAQLLRECESD